MFTLTSHISIGSAAFSSLHNVRVKKSILSFVDTATIELPTTARLKKVGDLQTRSVETAKQFQEGDKVKIQLGYDSALQTEFEGFVQRVDFGSPCKMVCEGYVYQLRQKTHAKSWKNGKVKDILTWIIQGTDIKIHPDTPDSSFDGLFTLNNEDGAKALEKLDKDLFFTVYFVGNLLYVGPLETSQVSNAVKYRLGWNTIKDDQLVFRREEDARVRIKATYKDKKGRTVQKLFGQTGGREQTIELKRTVLDMDWLRRQVNQKAREFTYAGYEGKITTFLQPFALPGWKATIEDQKFSERDGDYLIVSTEVQFGTRGGRRIVELGSSLNNNYELSESA